MPAMLGEADADHTVKSMLSAVRRRLGAHKNLAGRRLAGIMRTTPAMDQNHAVLRTLRAIRGRLAAVNIKPR